MMNELIIEAAKAVVWVTIGTTPAVFTVIITMFFDIRSLKRSLNAAFSKIRDLEEGPDRRPDCGREL